MFQLTLGSSFVLNDLDETHLFVTAEIIAPLQVSFIGANSRSYTPTPKNYDIVFSCVIYFISLQEKIDDLMDKMNVPVVDGKSGQDK